VWYAFCKFWTQVLFSVFFRIRVHGQRNVPKTGPVILASTHQSFLDPMVVELGLSRPGHIMARDTLFTNKAFGALIRSLNAFPIERNSADLGAFREAIGRLREDKMLLLFPEAMREASKLGTPLLNPGLSFSQGVGLEVILTMFLMLVLLGSSIDRRGAKIGGFGAGLALTMGYLVAGPLTLAAMNPARAFGPALMSGEWADHLVYWIGPIIGAVLAALLYQYVFSEAAVATASEPASEEAVEPSDEAAEAADDEEASVEEAILAELDAEPEPESEEPESDEGTADADAEQSGDSDEAGDDEEES